MALKWSDETFWEASPRFLFSQLDIHNKTFDKNNTNKKEVVKDNNYSLERRKEGNKIITVEKKKLKVI